MKQQKLYRIIKLMLKNLFTKLKSQKSSTIKNQSTNLLSQRELIQNDYISKQKSSKSQHNIEQYQSVGKKLCLQSSYQKNIVKSNIRQVRYWSNDQIPNIFNTILSCPISHYNLLPHSKRKVKQIDLKKHPFPEYLNFMKPLLQKQLPTYNHILINYYPIGIGIMHHFDGPLYRDKVVVLSLGGPVRISFNQGYSKEKQNLKIMLQDKSIHIFQQDAYNKYLHGIEDSRVDSFTFIIQKCEQKGNSQSRQKFNSQDLQGRQYTNSQDLQSRQKVNSQDQQGRRNVKQNNSILMISQGYLISECSIDNLSNLNHITKLIKQNSSRLCFQQCQKSTTDQQGGCIQFDAEQGCPKLKALQKYEWGRFRVAKYPIQWIQVENVNVKGIKNIDNNPIEVQCRIKRVNRSYPEFWLSLRLQSWMGGDNLYTRIEGSSVCKQVAWVPRMGNNCYGIWGWGCKELL